jgi:hypothetical protein
MGWLDQYLRELHGITEAKDIPSDWATTDQRCRAAIKAVARYGHVIHFKPQSQTDLKGSCILPH